MSELKSTLDVIKDRLDIKEQISEREDVAIQTIQNETERKNVLFFFKGKEHEV